jgi:hypothetical protein
MIAAITIALPLHPRACAGMAGGSIVCTGVAKLAEAAFSPRAEPAFRQRVAPAFLQQAEAAYCSLVCLPDDEMGILSTSFMSSIFSDLSDSFVSL